MVKVYLAINKGRVLIVFLFEFLFPEINSTLKEVKQESKIGDLLNAGNSIVWLHK